MKSLAIPSGMVYSGLNSGWKRDRSEIEKPEKISAAFDFGFSMKR